MHIAWDISPSPIILYTHTVTALPFFLFVLSCEIAGTEAPPWWAGTQCWSLAAPVTLYLRDSWILACSLSFLFCVLVWRVGSWDCVFPFLLPQLHKPHFQPLFDLLFLLIILYYIDPRHYLLYLNKLIFSLSKPILWSVLFMLCLWAGS